MKKETKNMIILITVCVVTLFLLFLTIRLNHNRINDMNSNSYISTYLTEIDYSSIDDFVVENPNVIIYVSNSKDNKSIKFEKVLAKAVKKYNLEDTFYFININDTNLVDLLYQNAPEIIIYKDGEANEVIDATTISDYDSLVKMLKERSIINE